MKKKRSFRSILHDWDEGQLDLTNEIMGDLHTLPEGQTADDGKWKHETVKGLFSPDSRIYSAVNGFFAGLLAVVIIGFLLFVVTRMPEFNSAFTPANNSTVIHRYITSGLQETGAVNIVAGVILDYRAFDTLGESHVLFTAAAAVMILLLLEREEEESPQESAILKDDLVVTNTARILVPFIVLFGIYVILNGHLGPGGGFSGGAVIGGGLILYSSAFRPEPLRRVLTLKVYRRIVLLALSFYSLSKCYSFFCGANGLHTIFKTGTPGAIFSAGLILPLNIAVGIVVACTMYGFYALFTRGRI